MLIGRRFGRPGLIGTIARTAVITGTAAMTAGAIAHHQQRKRAAAESGAAAADVSAQASASSAPQTTDPLVEQLSRLSSLHESGALSDQEFADAKAKLLG